METIEVISAIKQNQSKQLVQALYKTALPPIVIYIKQKRGTRNDAEDCFQEALMTLIRKVHDNTYDESYEVKNFLFVLCRNIWFNKLKRKGKVESADLDEMHIQDDSERIDEKLISDERQDAVSKLMNLAGERCKELLTLLLFEKKKMKEVAILMGFSSEEVVKTNNYRCKQKLKKALEQDHQLMLALK